MKIYLEWNKKIPKTLWRDRNFDLKKTACGDEGSRSTIRSVI